MGTESTKQVFKDPVNCCGLLERDHLYRIVRLLNDDVGGLPGISVRTANRIQQIGWITIGDLVMRTEDEIRDRRGLGKKAFKEVTEGLAKLGLQLWPWDKSL